jgi:GAF domain-containing protein
LQETNAFSVDKIMNFLNMNRKETYEQVLIQMKEVIDSELDNTTNILQILSLLKHTFGWYWVGLYNIRDNDLYLGLFQGMIACTHIQQGKGVCGAAALEKRSIVVDDISLFPGYIACHAEPKSEIVVPGIRDDKVLFVLDIDSTREADFNETDVRYLEIIIKHIMALY